MDSFTSSEDDVYMDDDNEVKERMEVFKKTQENRWHEFVEKYSFLDESFSSIPTLGKHEISSCELDNVLEKSEENFLVQNTVKISKNNFDLEDNSARVSAYTKFKEILASQSTQLRYSANPERSNNSKESSTRVKARKFSQKISSNKNDNPEYCSKLSENMTKTHRLKVLENFIEHDLKSRLEYYYIQLLSSCIRRDKNQSQWRNVFVRELLHVRKRVKDSDILIYIKGIICPIYKHQPALINMIENEYKSNLKLYFQMAYEKVDTDEECWIRIRKEWDLLNETIPEKCLCAYHVILFGNNLYKEQRIFYSQIKGSMEPWLPPTFQRAVEHIIYRCVPEKTT